MEDEKYTVPKDIIELAKQLNDLYKIMYEMIKPEVLYIINKKVRNVVIIEDTLDRLFDIPTDEAYELFKQLCDYYMLIDAEAAKFYLESYDELYGDEEVKTKKKTISD